MQASNRWSFAMRSIKENVVIPFKQPEQSPDYGIYRRVKSSHEPKVEGKSHGKEQAVSSGGIHERVFHRGKMPGVYGKFAVGGRIFLPQMRLPPRLPAIQWSVSMCRMPQATLSDSGTVLHKSHMPLTPWFLAFYFVR